MKTSVVNRLANDFLAWSGGFAPNSEEQISVYTDYARPIEISSSTAWAILAEWLRRQAHPHGGQESLKVGRNVDQQRLI